MREEGRTEKDAIPEEAAGPEAPLIASALKASLRSRSGAMSVGAAGRIRASGDQTYWVLSPVFAALMEPTMPFLQCWP